MNAHLCYYYHSLKVLSEVATFFSLIAHYSKRIYYRRCLQMSELKLGVCMCKIMSDCFGFCRGWRQPPTNIMTEKKNWRWPHSSSRAAAAKPIHKENVYPPPRFRHYKEWDVFSKRTKVVQQMGSSFYLKLLEADLERKNVSLRKCESRRSHQRWTVRRSPAAWRLPGGRTSFRVQRPESLLSTKAPGVWQTGGKARSTHPQTHHTKPKDFFLETKKSLSGLWRRTWALSPQERASVSQMAEPMGATDFPHSSL